MAKPTNKERDQQITWLSNQVANLNRLFGTYIEFSGNSADFQKHLIDLNEKSKKEVKDDKNIDRKVDS